MKLCAIDPKELEEKILTRFAENQNDELLEDLSDYVINSQKEIERLNNIINEFNSSYYKIIKECEEMINDRYYMNENAIKYHANRIRDIAKYYVEEPKWQELKGDDK